jgi:hypothetical protein
MTRNAIIERHATGEHPGSAFIQSTDDPALHSRPTLVSMSLCLTPALGHQVRLPA